MYMNQDSIMKLNKISSILEESPHKDNPLLSKLLSRNQERRNNLAQKLTYLRQARDKSRAAGKTYKANAIDNVSRAITNAPSTDPVLKNLAATGLNKMQDKSNLLNYIPRQTNLPSNRLDGLKNRIDLENKYPNQFANKLSRYVGKNDISNYQGQLNRFNNRTPVNDNVLEMFKYQPRLAGVKREINPLLDYNQSKRSLRFY